MKLYNRNGTIYADFTVCGKRYRRSLGLAYTRTNLNNAMKNIIPNMILELENKAQNRQTYTLLELINKQRTHWQNLKPNTKASYKIYSKFAIEFLGDKDIKEYQISDIDRLFEYMDKNNYSPSTTKIVSTILNSCFKLAQRLGVIDTLPLIKPQITNKKQKIKRQVYNKEQIKLMLKHSSSELRLFLYFAIYTGARANEILALKYQDIKDDCIIISKTYSSKSTNTPHTTKNNKTRIVFMPPELMSYLSELKLCNGFIFSLRYATIRSKFKSLCKKLNIKYAGLHSFRHTFASMLLNSGVNPYTIAQSLGHKDLVMLQNIYGHFLGFNNKDKNAISNVLDFG